MSKLITAITAILIALTAIASAAEAGCGGGGGGYSRSYHRPAQSFRRAKPRMQVAAPKPSKARQVAEAAEPAEASESPAKGARTENSSIAVDETDEPKPAKKVAEKSARKGEQKVASAGPLGCKMFLPSVGMTVSVACEK